MHSVLSELKRAAHTRANRSLCEARGISADDVVSAVLVRSLHAGHGVAFVADPVTRRRYAAVAVRSAIYDEVKKASRRRCVDLADAFSLADPRPSPLEVLLAKEPEEREGVPTGRVLAMAMQFPTIAEAIGGATYTRQARARGVAASTVTRQAKRALKQIRDFFLGAQLQLPLDGALSSITQGADE